MEKIIFLWRDTKNWGAPVLVPLAPGSYAYEIIDSFSNSCFSLPASSPSYVSIIIMMEFNQLYIIVLTITIASYSQPTEQRNTCAYKQSGT